MPYQETQEQSAEILRQVIALMGRHRAPYHPITYAVWYEHVAGINTPLSEALQKRLAAQAPLIDAELRRLHSMFIAARDAIEAEKVQREFELLLNSSSQAAIDAEFGVSRFKSALLEHSQRLDQALDPHNVKQIVGSVLEEARQALSVVTELAESLAHQTREIEGLRERASQAHSEAVMDPLTGVRNPRGFKRALENMAERGRLFEGASLVLIDIDRFKTINDTHGHVIGDKVLKAVAEVVRECTRRGDLPARLGGDEFAVFLPNTAVEGARAVAENIRARVANLRIFARNDATEELDRFTVSIGVSGSKLNDALDDLISRADKGLYAAKHAGRNCVRANQGQVEVGGCAPE